MSNIIENYFSTYKNSKTKFDEFHNNVINMPRANFSELSNTIKLLKSLASYILTIDEDILCEPISRKTLYSNIFLNYKNGTLPPDEFRNLEFEKTYLDLKDDFDKLYGDEGGKGRMFRHYMEYFSFFGYFYNYENRTTKIVNIDGLKELILSPNEIVSDLFRNILLSVNINNNDYIKNMKGISVKDDADYCPAKAIIFYCKEMNRPVTDFEVSILLGRVDNIQKEKEILKRAIDIGKVLPKSKINQIKYFFGCLGWKSSSDLFEYSQSQNPDFKFKVFLLFMENFELIQYNKENNEITLTDYSKQLQLEDIDFELLDLEHLLELIDDYTSDSNKLADLIIRKRTDAITRAIKNDDDLVKKMNARNIKLAIVKNGKRQRNKLIAEIAKIKADYLDEVTREKTFEDKYGKNYVEAHHIIEFNGENGPDITDNLICLGPQNHSLIHHGSKDELEDFYNTCKTRGILSFDRFKNIVVEYRCLTKDHVKILLNKKIISSHDATELNDLIDKIGIDPTFLNSINIRN